MKVRTVDTKSLYIGLRQTFHLIVIFTLFHPVREATSALDARSEYHINQALQAMAKGRTVISIAHRLSTIREADLVAVLKGGEIVETGTFDELIRKEGVFHKLVERQLTDFQSFISGGRNKGSA